MSASSSIDKCYIVNYNTNRQIILIISIIIPIMIVQMFILFVSLRIGSTQLVQYRYLLFEVAVPSQESEQSYLCVRSIEFPSLYDLDTKKVFECGIVTNGVECFFFLYFITLDLVGVVTLIF